MTRLFVQTNRTADPAAWAAAHSRGENPDRVPYGLNHLEAFGYTVNHREPLHGRMTETGARAARAVGHRWDWWGSRNVARGSAELNLCWDERSGIPTALASHDNSPAVATGVIWLTDTDQRLTAPFTALARRALQRARAVWALSSAQIPVLEAHLGVPSSRCFRLPFGIDADFWSTDRAEQSISSPDTPVILAVGNDRHRDHTALVGSLATICTAGEATLHLVTEQAIDLTPDIGHRTAALTHPLLRDAYQAATLVAISLRPNLHVSGMTTVLEAQAMARPVVCTATPGMADYVIDGVTGLLVEPGDPAAMQRAVRSILNDPDRGVEMGRAGREFVEQQATSRTQAGHLADILATCL